MTSFDSHAHFPTASAAEHHAQIARAREAGLCGILAVGGGPELDPGAIAMARECPADVHLALGLDRDVAMTAAPDAATLAASMTSLRGTLARLADDWALWARPSAGACWHPRRPRPRGRSERRTCAISSIA